MQLSNKNWGATNTPRSLAMKNKTAREYSIAINGLQDLRNIAWKYAMKYRFDPALSRAHEEYLNILNNLLKEYGL